MLSCDDCFKKGLLKKDIPQKDIALKSLKQAEFFLNETKDLVDIQKDQMAVISLYNAFFHTSRSLLYKDGIKERSHYCIARYIEENYELEKFLNAYETIMSLRHNVQYATEAVEIDLDFSEFIEICEKYILKVEELCKEK